MNSSAETGFISIASSHSVDQTVNKFEEILRAKGIDTLKSVSFIEKDSKRFPDTSGWGYAQFLYDAASDTFKPFGSGSSFGKAECYECYTRVKERDYIFMSYPKR